MPTHLSPEEHVDALRLAGRVLREEAAAAGLDAKVPTCPRWRVRDLVAHQGMVHRWAAAHLRGDRHHRTTDSLAEAEAAPDLLAWFSAGVDALVETWRATPDEATAMVFLKDAPPPRAFWARRQAHETTIHSADARSARLGRWLTAADMRLDAALAADGIDELLCGFITRGSGRLRSHEPYTILVRAVDTGHAWTLRVSDGPVVTTPGGTGSADAEFTGTAVQLYLSLWNRADDMTVSGRADVIEQWRSQVRVRWR